MNLLADEGIDRQIVERLRQDGHAVTYIAESAAGMADATILTLTNEYEAVLVTRDKDFGELVYRLQQVHRGVILVRLDGLRPEQKAEVVSQALFAHGTAMIGAFSVISYGNVRIRRMMP
jgi:predicted nuclease of predicted toxin-antitoxin system